MAEQPQLGAKDDIEARFVRRMKRDEAFAFLLVKLLLFQHSDFVVSGVHAPILDVDVQLGQVEVGADGVSAEDSEPFVVAISDAVGDKPVGNQSFAIGLNQRSGFGGNGFVEFDVGVEIAPVEKDFVEAGVTKCALEGLLAARVLLGGRFTAAP